MMNFSNSNLSTLFSGYMNIINVKHKETDVRRHQIDGQGLCGYIIKVGCIENY